MKACYLLLLLLAINSCIDPKQPEKIDKYYDLSGKLDNKTEQLSNLDFSLEKEGYFGEFREKIVLAKDSIASLSKGNSIDQFFQNEWELFYALDLNKQGKIGNYSMQESDTSTHFTLKPESEGKVRFLKLTFFNKKNDVIKKIEALTKDDNVLYSIENKLTMYFKPGNKNEVLTYRMESDQKVKLQDRKQFSMEGKFVY